ncbi:MAG TPA: ABC transporter permease [bacterium]|nr:ABC transporter permease [bacterium]
MERYVARRLLEAVLVLFGISAVAFALTHVIGDPVVLLLPFQAGPAQVAEMRHILGLDRPLPVQYLAFLAAALHGDFGLSVRQNTPALGLVLDRVPATAELASTALVIAVGLAVPLGIAAALHRRRAVDRVALLFSMLGQSMPTFWLGLQAILLFGVVLRWFPTGGMGGFRHLVLPAVVLGIFSAAGILRLTRTSMLDIISEDYLRTARAKGLREAAVVGRHALRNASLPIVTWIGLELGTLLGGAVVTETVFAWPGMGRLAVQAIFARDIPVVQAVVLFAASIFVTATFCTDMLYAWLDPRIHYQ